MTKVLPPDLVAKFDHAYQHNALALDRMVAAHRSYCGNESERILSMLGQVDAARHLPEGAFHILAVAVDRLAALQNAADQLAAMQQ